MALAGVERELGERFPVRPPAYLLDIDTERLHTTGSAEHPVR